VSEVVTLEGAPHIWIHQTVGHGREPWVQNRNTNIDDGAVDRRADRLADDPHEHV
jgi:hypothetical protein